MPKISLEQRVAALEQQVAELRGPSVTGPGTDEWRQTIGMFTDNAGMQELFADAMRMREANRKKARRRTRKAKQVKS